MFKDGGVALVGENAKRGSSLRPHKPTSSGLVVTSSGTGNQLQADSSEPKGPRLPNQLANGQTERMRETLQLWLKAI